MKGRQTGRRRRQRKYQGEHKTSGINDEILMMFNAIKDKPTDKRKSDTMMKQYDRRN